MKQVLRFLALAALICVPWVTQAQQAIPYSYGFENNDLSAAGWTTQNPSGLNASEFGIKRSAKKTGSYGFRFSSYNDGGTNTQYLISPELSAAGGVVVQFYYKGSSSSGDEVFKVGYSTTGTNISDFTFGSEIATEGNTSWTLSDEFTFPAGTKYVAIYYYANYQYRLYVDDISFTAPASCAKPTLSSTVATTHNAATITWTPANASQTLFDIFWSETNTAPTSETTPGALNQSGTSYTISGLTASTNYYVWIRGNCGTDGLSDWTTATVSFKTKCDPTDLPYSTNFDAMTTGNVPDCWTLVSGVAGSSGTAVYGYNYNSASKCLCFYNGSGTTTLMILPPLSVEANTTQVEFYAKAGGTTSYYGTFYVGYMTDASDPSTFHELKTMPAAEYGSYTLVKVPMTSAPDDAVIAMKLVAGSAYGYGWYVDDVTIGEAPSCVAVTPGATTNITATGATLHWTSTNAATTTYTITDGDAIDVTTAAGATSHPLTGLTPGTTYSTLTITANCGVSDHSDPVNVPSFSTAYGVPFDESFGTSLPSNWAMYTGQYNESTHTATLASGSPWNFGEKNGVFDNHARANIFSTGCYKWLVTPGIVMEDNVQITFDLALTKYSGSNQQVAQDNQADDKFIVLVTTDNGETWTVLRKWDNAGSSYVYDSIAYSATGQTEAIDLSAYAGQTVKIAFYGESTVEGGDNNIHIDNVSIDYIPNCAKPTGLAKANVAAHTVDLSWTKGDAETAWDICINGDVANPVSIGENNVTITGSSVSYTLTGLDPDADYTVKVRANCGGGNGVSQWSNEVSFTTTVACPAPTSPSRHDITAHTATLKWIGNAASSNYEVKYRTAAGVDLNTSVLDEDFTGLSSGIPTGWDNSEGTTTNDDYKWNYHNSGHNAAPCVRFNSYNNSDGKTNFLKTPAMAFPAGKTMVLSFWWKNPDGDDFSVYISTDGGTTKTPLKSGMTSQSSWKQESISLSDYVGATNVTIHFKGTSNCGYGDAYIYLDDIMIAEEIPAGDWQTVDPANITVTPGTYVGAASLSGLLAETKYEAYVRTDCNAAGDGYSTTQLDFTPFTTDIACKKPTTLAADATGATTVTLSWTNGEEGQNAWQICINGDEEHLVAANANPFTVEGLTPATTYSFKVRANCTAASDGYSDWSNLLENVETQAACPTPVLAANGITNITDNSATVTWTGFAENQDFTVSYRTAATMGNPIFNEDFSSGIGEWTMSNCHASTGVNNEAFRFRWTTTPPQYLISPEISGIDAEVILEFQYKDGDYTELFQVGYSTTDNNVSSFTFGAEIATPSDQTWHTYHGTLPAGTKYISIKCNSDDQYYLYVDDIVIASEVAAGGWQTVSPNPTTTTTTITGLSPETKYDVKVQANCALSQTSGESEVRSFTTFYGATLDVTANSWYAIASPVHNSGKNETVVGVDNLIAADPVKYDFLRYNEQYAKWESQKDDGFDAMERGRGHIYRRSAATTLKFIGERNTGNITYFCQGASSGTMKGWNLIGNPYPHEITRAHISQAYGYLVDGYYTLQASGSWRAEANSNAPIAVGQAILVKVTYGGNVTFSETAPSTKSAPASTIAFTVSNDEFTDIAYARFSSEEGLPKISHLNPEAPMLSIDGYAIANLNEGIESFPMSFSGQGSYTLTVSGNTDVTGYLHLVDRLTGRDIDLLSTPSYSFTGSPVSDRFTVKLTPDANEGNSTSRFAIFDGNSLIVNGEGTLEVYDVMGRRLMSAEVTGSEYRISGSDLHTGVYVLRMNGNSQKIVIK